MKSFVIHGFRWTRLCSDRMKVAFDAHTKRHVTSHTILSHSLLLNFLFRHIQHLTLSVVTSVCSIFIYIGKVPILLFIKLSIWCDWKVEFMKFRLLNQPAHSIIIFVANRLWGNFLHIFDLSAMNKISSLFSSLFRLWLCFRKFSYHRIRHT